MKKKKATGGYQLLVPFLDQNSHISLVSIPKTFSPSYPPLIVRFHDPHHGSSHWTGFCRTPAPTKKKSAALMAASKDAVVPERCLCFPFLYPETPRTLVIHRFVLSHSLVSSQYFLSASLITLPEFFTPSYTASQNSNATLRSPRTSMDCGK
ncbi:hypothetical protein DM02DRAFT_164345 [Periconia macrospinosa]|uniref:Uncharacterized protein n=1 Tax=Periconia macrospinosa TaxID=97972 RepID=A0A2V1DAU9_9PLEO|nr:hypothetical protein DM02DRAFT_164345 [Periconia macrospinosa]